MELLDRYLHAVKFWLPSRQQDDIIAELSEDVLSQIGEEEGRLGRKLNENELAEILKRCGDPMLVAGRLLPQQHLIGPPWFPLYLWILRLVLLWVLLPLSILVATGTAFFRAQDRAMAVLQTLGGLWTGALTAFATITIVFAVLERFQHKLHVKEWDPHRLPAVPKTRDSRKILRVASVVEIVWGLIFVFWWVGALHLPSIPGNTVQVRLTPVWQQFYWLIILTSVASVTLSSANLIRPWWSRLRAGIRLAIDATTAVMAFLLVRMGPLVDVTSVSVTGEQLARIRQATESAMPIGFAVVAVICSLACLQDARRMMSVKAHHQPGARNLAGGAATRP